jgi:hypothetical protein
LHTPLAARKSQVSRKGTAGDNLAIFRKGERSDKYSLLFPNKNGNLPNLKKFFNA